MASQKSYDLIFQKDLFGLNFHYLFEKKRIYLQKNAPFCDQKVSPTLTSMVRQFLRKLPSDWNIQQPKWTKAQFLTIQKSKIRDPDNLNSSLSVVFDSNQFMNPFPPQTDPNTCFLSMLETSEYFIRPSLRSLKIERLSTMVQPPQIT